MKFRGSSLLSNVLTSLGGYAVLIVTTFIMAPMLVRHLGDAGYGVWSLITELTGYYGVFDAGLRMALIYYISHYSARGDNDRVNSTCASGFWLLCGLSALSVLIVVPLIRDAPRILGKAAAGVADAPTAAAILLCVVIAGLPMAVSSAIVTGRLRLDILNVIEVSSRVCMAAGSVIVLTAGGRLLALSLMLLAIRVCAWTAQWIVAFRLTPYLSLRPRWFHGASVRSLLSYGGQTFFLVATQMLIPRASSLIVALTIGVKWVTYYTLGTMLVMYAAELCGAATRALTPHYSTLYAQGKLEELSRLYLKSSRIVASLFSFAGAGVAGFAGAFLALWIGPRFVNVHWTERSDVVCMILVFAQTARQFHSASWHLLLASKRQRFLTALNAFEAVAGISLSLLLVPHFRIAGVAMGITIPVLITHGILLPRYIARHFALGRTPFVRVFTRPLAMAVLLFLINTLLVRTIQPHTWPALIGAVLLACVVGAAVYYTLGVASSERAELRLWLSSKYNRRSRERVPANTPLVDPEADA